MPKMKSRTYVEFTKEMKDKGYTILAPCMLPVHFRLVINVFRSFGYKVDLLEELAVLVNDPVVILERDIAHGAALRDGDDDAARQLARDHDVVDVGQLFEDAARRVIAVDEEEVFALFEPGGEDDLLIRIAGVALDLDGRDGEENAHRQQNQNDAPEEDPEPAVPSAKFHIFDLHYLPVS